MYLLALAALAVAWYFLDAAWRRPSPPAIVAGILWLLYAVWEFLIYYGVLCDANCNIRVDLLLFWPLLGIVTLYASNTPDQRSVVRRLLGAIALVIFVLLVTPLIYIAFIGLPAEKQSDQGPKPSSK